MGIDRSLVETAIAAASSTDLEWLHVDFDDDLTAFYIDACGFEASHAGPMDLTRLGGDRQSIHDTQVWFADS